MYVMKLPSAAASIITVTNTATDIISLITTAASGTDPNLRAANAIDITPEDGDIRVLIDGNNPTASEGFLLKQGTVAVYRGIPLVNMKLIRAGGSDVSCSIQVGRSNPDESTVISTSPSSATLSLSGGIQEKAVSSAIGNAVTITQSGVQIVAADTDRNYTQLYNNGSKTVFYGPTGVTTATGMPLLPNGSAPWDSAAACKGITNTGETSEIRFIDFTN